MLRTKKTRVLRIEITQQKEKKEKKVKKEEKNDLAFRVENNEMERRGEDSTFYPRNDTIVMMIVT